MPSLQTLFTHETSSWGSKKLCRYQWASPAEVFGFLLNPAGLPSGSFRFLTESRWLAQRKFPVSYYKTKPCPSPVAG